MRHPAPAHARRRRIAAVAAADRRAVPSLRKWTRSRRKQVRC